MLQCSESASERLPSWKGERYKNTERKVESEGGDMTMVHKRMDVVSVSMGVAAGILPGRGGDSDTSLS